MSYGGTVLFYGKENGREENPPLRSTRRDSPQKRKRQRKPFCMYSMYFYSDTVSVPLCKRRTPSKPLQIDVTKKFQTFLLQIASRFMALLPSPSSTAHTTAFVPLFSIFSKGHPGICATAEKEGGREGMSTEEGEEEG